MLTGDVGGKPETSHGGCKNLEKILWTKEFLKTDSHASTFHAKDTRSWVSTVVILNSLKTEIARSVRGTKVQEPLQKTLWRAVPRAENFGDLKTADHKVFSDNCESRNNHRYAIVVQD